MIDNRSTYLQPADLCLITKQTAHVEWNEIQKSEGCLGVACAAGVQTSMRRTWRETPLCIWRHPAATLLCSLLCCRQSP